MVGLKGWGGVWWTVECGGLWSVGRIWRGMGSRDVKGQETRDKQTVRYVMGRDSSNESERQTNRQTES